MEGLRMPLVMVFVLVLFIQTANGSLCDGGGQVTPDDPYYFINETSDLICSLMDTSLRNATDLYFKHDGVEVDSVYYKVINESTLMLNKTMEKSDEGLYSCWLRGATHCLDSQILQVDYPLEPVNDITCIWHHWRESLECSWELPPYHMEYITVTLNWFIPPNSYGTCPHLSTDQQKCTWSRADAALDVTRFFFLFNITNTKIGDSAVGNYISKTPKDNVKPYKVKRDTIRYKFTNDSSCLQLTWTYYSDTLTNSRYRIFRIKYFPTHRPNQNNTVLTEVNSSNWTFCGLNPNTEYNFSIDVHPAFQNRIREGYWSDPVMVNFTTDEDVPAAAPEMVVGGYERDVDGCVWGESEEKTGNFSIYWKSIPENQTNGQITKLNITYTSLSGVRKYVELTNVLATSTVLSLNCNTQYNVTVTAATKKGFYPHFSSIIVNTADMNPPIVMVEERNDKYNVTWTVTGPVDHATRFMVIYCEGQGLRCLTDIQYRAVENWEDRHLTLTLNSRKSYLFGVSSTKDNIGSGVKFQSCIYNGNEVPRAPDFTVDNSAGDNNLRVKWTPIPCSSETPYIVSYTIVWCKTNKEKKCTGSQHLKNFKATADVGEFIITGLEKDAAYGVKMLSSSYRANSPYSEMMLGYPLNKDLTLGQLAGVVVAALIVFILLIAGIIFMIRICGGKCREIAEPFKVEVPDINGKVITVSLTHSTSSSGVSANSFTEVQLPETNHKTQVHQIQVSNDKGRETSRQISQDSGRGSLPSDEQDGLEQTLDTVYEESSPYTQAPGVTTENITSGSTASDTNAYTTIGNNNYTEGSSGDGQREIIVGIVQQEVHFINTRQHQVTDIDSPDPSVREDDDVFPTLKGYSNDAFIGQDCIDNLDSDYIEQHKKQGDPCIETAQPSPSGYISPPYTLYTEEAMVCNGSEIDENSVALIEMSPDDTSNQAVSDAPCSDYSKNTLLTPHTQDSS